jgi:two-component system, chemotaxis family, response regulator PixG
MNNDLQYSMAVEPQRNSIGRLQYLGWGEFTGVVDITVASGQAWEIVFYQGQIVWSLDLDRPNRLWERLVRTHCEDGQITLESLVAAANRSSWSGLVQRHQTCWYYQGAITSIDSTDIRLSQVKAILTTAAVETIFDLLQYSQGQKLTFRSQSEIFVDRPPVLVNTDDVIAQAETMWHEWHQQKLGNISPNKTPAIKHPVQLYRQTTPVIYQNLIRVVTGQRTLREIALDIDQDLLLLTRSLTRYIQTGIIELTDSPDLILPEISSELLNQKSNRLLVNTQKSRLIQSKLVICIDDSPQVCELMRSIVTGIGCRFISIQDATQALPKLLENKPDLIFLDLIMPKINGYEICGQIKRISSLSRIPIVILTGRDGLLDRLRSKVVGASEFIAKPITKDAIDSSLNKHILVV